MGDLLGFWYGRWITFAVRHLAKMVPAYRLPLSAGREVTTFKKAIADGASMTLKSSPQTLDSLAFLQYTGGTTGLSKGAELTHGNIVAAILQAEAWFTPGAQAHRRSRQDQQHRRAAAVPHLRADPVPAGDPLGIAPDLDPQSARFRQVRRGAQEAALPSAARGEHLVQCAVAAPAIQVRRFFAAVPVAGRRHGRFGGHGPPVAKGHRLRDGRGLGHERDLRHRHQQHRHQPGIHRHHRPAAARDRDRHQGRSRRVAAAGRVRRNLHQGAQRDARLLPAAGRDESRVHGGWFHAHGRHRHHGLAAATSRSSTARRT